MPHDDPESHTMGDNHSIFTSWTKDRSTAEHFARGTDNTEGVVLIKRFKVSELVQSNLSTFMQEEEFLVPGVVTGASAKEIKPKPPR